MAKKIFRFTLVFISFSLCWIGFSSRSYAQDAQQIINQTIAAHGGVALSQIYSSVATALLTDYRINPSFPLPATFKSFGKVTRIEYTDVQGSIALIRNGSLNWEVRPTQAHEYSSQPPAFQDVFFSPSLGMVRNLSTRDFFYYNTVNLRGRPAYVLWKAYWTEPFGSSNYRGTQEYIYVYIDTATYLLAQIDYTYGSGYNGLSFHFDNYLAISGIAVPGTVTHWINSRTVWQIQVQTASFNQNLNPQDFVRPF